VLETWLPVDRAATAFVATVLAADSGNFEQTSAERSRCGSACVTRGISASTSRSCPHAEWERGDRSGKAAPEYEFAVTASAAQAGPMRPEDRDFQPVVVRGVDRDVIKTLAPASPGGTLTWPRSGQPCRDRPAARSAVDIST